MMPPSLQFSRLLSRRQWSVQNEETAASFLYCGGPIDVSAHTSPVDEEGHPRNRDDQSGWNVRLDEVVAERALEEETRFETGEVACKY